MIKCRQAERFLYLHREGELTPEQVGRLNRHLSQCQSCKDKADSIQQVLVRLEDYRIADTEPSGDKSLTNEIMTGLIREELGQRKRAIKLSYSGINGLSISRIQPLMVAATLLIIVGILTLQITIQSRISSLELSLSQRQVQTELFTETGFVRDLDRYSKGGLLQQAGFSGQLGESDWIVIRRSDLAFIMSRYGISGIEGSILLQRARRQIPILGSIEFEDGLSRAELEVLLKYRTEIVDALLQL